MISGFKNISKPVIFNTYFIWQDNYINGDMKLLFKVIYHVLLNKFMAIVYYISDLTLK